MPKRRTLALTVAALLLAYTVLQAGAPSASAAAVPCSPSRPHAAGDFNETITSGGLSRTYYMRVPASYTGDKAVPLLFNLHGYGSNSGAQAIYSGLPQKAEEKGFVLVSPQATGSPAHWNITLLEPADDVGFVRDMIDELEAELCIDASRIFSTGMSNGAAMSARLACNLSDRIVAVAPVAGVYMPLNCSSPRPVALIAFHGTADTFAPYNGGTSVIGLPFPSVESSMSAWAAFNGCTVGPIESDVTLNVRLKRYEDCGENAFVHLYIVDGGGHTWPDATIDLPPGTYGPTTHEISANDLMWEFFEQAGTPSVGGIARLPQPAIGESGTGGPSPAVIAFAVGAFAVIALAAVVARLYPR
jgi:polyhydroxybutyrate depolymerase